MDVYDYEYREKQKKKEEREDIIFRVIAIVAILLITLGSCCGCAQQPTGDIKVMIKSVSGETYTGVERNGITYATDRAGNHVRFIDKGNGVLTLVNHEGEVTTAGVTDLN